jgi:ATP-dependent DNA helicase RecG
VAAGSQGQPEPPDLRPPRSGPPATGLERLDAWCATLQQASQLEADRGFVNLQGRRDTYSGFVQRCLEAPVVELSEPEQASLASLARAFGDYRDGDLNQRRRLVSQLRQRLHLLRCQHRPPLPHSPPRLNLASPTAMAAPGQGRSAGDRIQRDLEPQTPLTEVPGIGPKIAAQLAGLGLLVVRDLLQHYPRDYLDYANLVRIGELVPGATATIVARIRHSHAFASPRNPNLSIHELHVQDVTGRLRVSRFLAGRRFSSPGWLKQQQRQFPAGATVAVSGLVRETPYGPAFRDPLIEVLEGPAAPVRSEQIGRIVPVYALTEGLSADRLRRCLSTVLPLVRHWSDPLSEELRREFALPPLADARAGIHQPLNRDHLQASRRRLVFDELFLLQLALGLRRQALRSRPAPMLQLPAGADDLVARLLELLPFPFTAAQTRVLAEIRADMAREQPMARLLQGDVGSGKTVVALAALLGAVQAGCQGALMAPTEVLAEQHLQRLAGWLPQLHVSFDLLTGSTPARRRRRMLDDLVNGQLQLLVGTHALLEDPVQFARLGLVVVDEQHRFGVRQRNRLLAKGLQPHLLTMTATPIPRTLALSLHGDLDVSQIDELPPGRTPVRTSLLSGGERGRAWSLIRDEVARGQRAYVVLPLVEESEKLDLRSAVEVHRHLAAEVFTDLRVGLLHGRLSSEAKQSVIAAFACGECQVLVSTTVVEVGVDVPEASVMVVDHAERFGLSQLHQLRGRVGRGAAASHCLLVQDGGGAVARQRLEVLVQSNDGFEIAEMDLRLRGPGQVLGTRQSGLPDLALASLSDDGAVMVQARSLAWRLLEQDPTLQTQPSLRHALEERRQRLLEAAQLN